jgi:hypothetical protein
VTKPVKPSGTSRLVQPKFLFAVEGAGHQTVNSERAETVIDFFAQGCPDNSLFSALIVDGVDQDS